jgi:hypothetical protein
MFTEIVIADEFVHAIKILKGSFKNIVYYYGGVKIVPEDDNHKLAYQYTVWDSAGISKDFLKNSEEFTTLMGDILVAIIADESEEGEYVTPREHDQVLDSEAWVEEKDKDQA